MHAEELSLNDIKTCKCHRSMYNISSIHQIPGTENNHYWVVYKLNTSFTTGMKPNFVVSKNIPTFARCIREFIEHSLIYHTHSEIRVSKSHSMIRIVSNSPNDNHYVCVWCVYVGEVVGGGCVCVVCMWMRWGWVVMEIGIVKTHSLQWNNCLCTLWPYFQHRAALFVCIPNFTRQLP